MSKRRRILVLDFSAENPRGPHAGSMYDCLERRYELRTLTAPVPSLAQCFTRLKTFSPHRGTWSRRYWAMLEKYQHSPNGFRATTQAYSRAVRSHLEKHPADLIFQYGALFGPVEAGAGLPYVTYHDSNMAITRSSSSYQAAFMSEAGYQEFFRLEQSLVQGASRVLTYSRRTRDSYVHDYGCDDGRVVAVGSSDWVRRGDEEWIERQLKADLDAMMQQRDPRLILFIHSNFTRKGGELLLQAFEQVQAEIPDARLLVVGPNPELARGRNVEAVGVVRDRKELLSFYRQASIFVLPSLNDPFPRVVFEAMIHGLPCIGTNVCGMPEQILHGRTGYTVDPGDAAGLAGHIRRLLENEEERRLFGRAGFEHAVENFLPEAVAARVAREVEAVCG